MRLNRRHRRERGVGDRRGAGASQRSSVGPSAAAVAGWSRSCGWKAMRGRRRPALQRPARPGHRHRAPGAHRRARAPADDRRRHAPARREQADGAVVLAEAEPAPRRPRGGPRRGRARPAARSRRARGRAPGAARARARSARAPRRSSSVRNSPSRAVRPQARSCRPSLRGKPDLVVAFAVQHDLGAVGRAGAQPGDERRDATRAAIRRASRAPPAAPGARRARRRAPTGASTPSASAGRDVVDRDEQAHPARMSAVDVEDAVEHGVPAVVRLGVAPARARRARRGRRAAGPLAASASAPASPEANVAPAPERPTVSATPPRSARQQRACRWRAPRAPRGRRSRSSTARPPGPPPREGRPAGRGPAGTGARTAARCPARRCSRRRAGPSPTSTSRAPVRRSTSGHAASSRSTSFSRGQAAHVDRQRPLGQAVARGGSPPRSARRRGMEPLEIHAERHAHDPLDPVPLELAGHEVRRRERRPHHPAEPADVAPGELGRRAPHRPGRLGPGRDDAGKVAVVEPDRRHVDAPGGQVHQPGREPGAADLDQVGPLVRHDPAGGPGGEHEAVGLLRGHRRPVQAVAADAARLEDLVARARAPRSPGAARAGAAT